MRAQFGIRHALTLGAVETDVMFAQHAELTSHQARAFVIVGDHDGTNACSAHSRWNEARGWGSRRTLLSKALASCRR